MSVTTLEPARTKPTVRVNVEMSEELNAKLDALASKAHGSKSDVLRRALALYDAAVRAHEAGLKVGFAAEDQELKTEVIGF
jgi:predicted transcriptional regulator